MSEEESNDDGCVSCFGCGCLPFIVLIIVMVVWSAISDARHDREAVRQLRERVEHVERRR